jgi:hypothetical protein
MEEKEAEMSILRFKPLKCSFEVATGMLLSEVLKHQI